MTELNVLYGPPLSASYICSTCIKHRKIAKLPKESQLSQSSQLSQISQRCRTEQQTNRPTDQSTDNVTYRAAWAAKNMVII